MSEPQPSPIILIACDLMLSSSVSGICQQLGRPMLTAASADAALDLLSEHPAATLAIDLNTPLDLAALAEQLAEDVRSQAIVFGPHVHVEKLQLARDSGFGTVTSRGHFMSNALQLLK